MQTEDSGNLELVRTEAEGGTSSAPMTVFPCELALLSSAEKLAHTMAWIPGERESRDFAERCGNLLQTFEPLLVALESTPDSSVFDDLQELNENVHLIEGELQGICQTFQARHKVAQVRTPDGHVISRIAAVADDYLAASGYKFSESSFATYIQAFQQVTVLDVAELWMLIPVLKLVLLEHVAERTAFLLKDRNHSDGAHDMLGSLQEIRQTTWKVVIEPLILFDQVLRQDPAGAYSRMDYDSRELYRRKVVDIADHCDCSEMKVASEVLSLARRAKRQASENPRVTERDSHVGSYLIAEGSAELERKVGLNPSFGQRLGSWLLQRPDDFYLPGIAVLTVVIVSSVVVMLTEPSTSLGLIFLALLAVLLPSSQSAIQIMNYVASLLIPAQILPKLDFSEGLPDDCVTMVAIPTMLLNEKQVRHLVNALEVRFLGNQDRNLHFLLLTDLPDSPSEPVEENALVDLAADLIGKLNEKYAAKKMGSFFLLHRHRVYNSRERVWMGWERKRGKLMDLNNLLCGQFDSFPVKIGDLSLLSKVRYIITLDSDTELPRGSARRMVGAMAHPLNKAIIDPTRGIVVAGYGILQPRVGVSVQSTARSRLAEIYSGQTGIDIYTHATSDIYQDLYGEGIFVGKGIYEVETLHTVLHGRFPRNALLSHDLMEGAYARAGLVSDIEVIEDYPSHYSAHNRRKHRWLRGDWQITEWLLPRVPDESGRRVPNPLSVVSRWKILDNLRRSLLEPAFFLLFVLSWTVLPGSAELWTLATIVILFLPALFQLGFELAQGVAAGSRAALAGALDGFINASIANVLMITFLAHQALLSLDAVVRTMVRRLITRQRLLEWETAAEAELAGEKRTMLDIYLNWTPALAFVLFFSIGVLKPSAVLAALPILVLWGCSKPISAWLDRPSRNPRGKASESNRWLLRSAALRTWRYFAEFSTEEHHWLIPDNVQEEGTRIAPRISPTNLGLLFNVRQVACDFGYLTVPEFAKLNLLTLESVSRFERCRGHLLNWYDTRTLVPLTPAIVSSVDNGNLVASLWTLQQGSLQLLSRPLLTAELATGLLDYLYLLTTLGALPRRKFATVEKELKRPGWLHSLLSQPAAPLANIDLNAASPTHAAEALWFEGQTKARIQHISQTVEQYAPWLLPEFSGLKEVPADRSQNHPDYLPAIEQMPSFIDGLVGRLQAAEQLATNTESSARYRKLLSLLPTARIHAVKLIDDLKSVANQAAQLADEMDFSFLFNQRRNLLSVAFEVAKQQLLPSCYDLLASEARIAYFVSIGKDEIPQDSWFLLGRAPTEDQPMVGLLSWTGTMFEFLMPALWMRSYPNTLLERAAIVAVGAQQAYAAEKGVPWGISESACAKTDDAGNYQYFPFGVPQLAVHKPEEYGPVISPYSTCLALSVDPPAALRNLRKIQHMRGVGPYGFFESLDFSPSRGRSQGRGPEIVRCWMAHHQGMSLLSIANFLHEEVVQKWFHAHPRVQATELLLQEKPVGPMRTSAAGAKAA
jgi:cyclic beta-1,2-glucan synthetase